MLNLEVGQDYFFIFLGTKARLFIFKFLVAKNCPSPSNQMIVPLVYIALSANISCEATPN